MWRRLNREEFAQVNPELKDSDKYGSLIWHVYDDYQMIEADEGLTYLQAANFDDAVPARAYYPLTDTPHLFLEFARLSELPGWENHVGEDPLSRWIDKYGLLGFAREEKQVVNDTPMSRVVERVFSRPMHDDRGGADELAAFYGWFADELNEALVYYEAVLSGDRDKLLEAHTLGHENQEEARLDCLERYEIRSEGESLEEYLTSRALFQIMEFTNASDLTWVRPSATFPMKPGSSWPPAIALEEISGRLEPKNLIGAMLLQFYWLLTSGNALTRCKYCNKRIVQSRRLGIRKGRSDRVYCDSRCRQNYHYHHRRKPAN